jgi:hypothetical protein
MDGHQPLSPTSYRGFVLTALATLFLVLSVAAGFCVLVDPYGIFGTPTLPRVNAIKSAAALRVRLSKAYRVALADPATLVVGSSVINLGIDPESPAWLPAHRPVFNLGIDGAPLAEQRRFLLNALAVAHPKLVLIVTSFEDVMPSVEGEMSSFDPELRALDDGRPNPHFALAHFKDLVSATLSFRAIADSAQTLIRQAGPWINYQRNDGFEINSPEERYAATQGVRAAVAKMDSDLALRISAWTRRPVWSLEPLDVMIRAARAAGADVVVAIPPVNTDIVEIRRQIGLAQDVAAWRSGIALVVAADAAALGGRERVKLWDFGGLSPYTTTSLPLEFDMAKRWFWDTAHFSPGLGTLIIGRIEGRGDPSDFGIVVDAQNEEKTAADFSAAERKWVDTHPDDVGRVSDLLAGMRQLICRKEDDSCDGPSAFHLASDRPPH